MGIGHKTTTVNGIEIDCKIVGLMREIWRLGLKTSSSCQGEKFGKHHPTEINFNHLEDALEFWSFIKDLTNEFGRIRIAFVTGPFPDSIQLDQEDIEIITEHLKLFPSKECTWLN